MITIYFPFTILIPGVCPVLLRTARNTDIKFAAIDRTVPLDVTIQIANTQPVKFLPLFNLPNLIFIITVSFSIRIRGV